MRESRPAAVPQPPLVPRLGVALCAGLLCVGCAGARAGAPAPGAPILTQSARESHWPVEGETRPGIWFRFSTTGDAPSPLPDDLRIVVDHGDRTQVMTGAAFSPLVGSTSMHQTRYLYTPASGVLFVTLALSTAGRQYFPDTQRIELNDDCWHMVTYRVRGAVASDPPPPPPYPRTTYLTPALSGDRPLYLEVHLSGNCFRNPLPPF
jgi:hypothetical protein